MDFCVLHYCSNGNNEEWRSTAFISLKAEQTHWNKCKMTILDPLIYPEWSLLECHPKLSSASFRNAFLCLFVVYASLSVSDCYRFIMGPCFICAAFSTHLIITCFVDYNATQVGPITNTVAETVPVRCLSISHALLQHKPFLSASHPVFNSPSQESAFQWPLRMHSLHWLLVQRNPWEKPIFSQTSRLPRACWYIPLEHGWCHFGYVCAKT